MNKNQKKLESFAVYCKTHPDERFWQALRNWSGFDFIYGGKGPLDDASLLHDTFYDE